jgi:hypothetical protein
MNLPWPKHRKARTCHPLSAAPRTPVEEAATLSRFGGAPWLSFVGTENQLRPCVEGSREPLALIVQLALDELPIRPALSGLLLQLFAESGTQGMGGVTGRIVDLDRERGRLAEVDLPEDAWCLPIRFEAGVADPVSPWDPFRLDSEPREERARPLERDKVLGNPVVMNYGWEDEPLGRCADCQTPFELLLHLEGKQNVPFSFGDCGWLEVGACLEHIWNFKVHTFQVP